MIEWKSDQALVPAEWLGDAATILEPEFDKMRAVVKAGGYDDERASLNAPGDQVFREQVKSVVRSCGQADTVLLVGMGGPGLGARAVQEAVTGALHNSFKVPKVYYADTVDPARIEALTRILSMDLEAKLRVVVVVATQSGTTTETIANFRHFSALLASHGLDPAEHMPLVTNEGSRLDQFGEAHGYFRVLVPPAIGGRYSVCSPVGLLPLALMGIDIDEFVAGAREQRDRLLALPLSENPAAFQAAALAFHAGEGKNVFVNFLFAPELESLGLWCRQLMAESLGKVRTSAGQAESVGITPTVAIGSRELHSTFQLYMDGPDDKLTTFVRVASAPSLRLTEDERYESLVRYLGETTYQEVSEAIFQGVLHAYDKRRRPYTVLTLPDTRPGTIGAFMQLKMIETMAAGWLLEVNPFDQPGVEAYKKETKRILRDRDRS